MARGTGSWWRSDAARHPRPRAWQVIRGRHRDRGPGVPPELRTRIFEPFARGRATDRAAGTGTGLGLAICRRIVDGHGGTIFIEDRPGGGARFVVNLPAPEASKG